MREVDVSRRGFEWVVLTQLCSEDIRRLLLLLSDASDHEKLRTVTLFIEVVYCIGLWLYDFHLVLIFAVETIDSMVEVRAPKPECPKR